MSSSSSFIARKGFVADDACLCAVVRSRSLLFYNEGAPLEESLAASEGEGLQTEGHSHNQISRYTADGHSNQTRGPKSDRRYKQTPLMLQYWHTTSQTLTNRLCLSSRPRETKPDGAAEFFWHSSASPHLTSPLWIPAKHPDAPDCWDQHSAGPKHASSSVCH